MRASSVPLGSMMSGENSSIHTSSDVFTEISPPSGA
jgi:hypothetical protein